MYQLLVNRALKQVLRFEAGCLPDLALPHHEATSKTKSRSLISRSLGSSIYLHSTDMMMMASHTYFIDFGVILARFDDAMIGFPVFISQMEAGY